MMKNQMLILMCVVLCLSTVEAQAEKCFFESDCSKDQTCVTPKGSLNGNCQPKAGVVPQEDNILGTASIIGDQGKCTFNTDCPDGGQCVKQPGSLYGTCQGSGYSVGNVTIQRDSVYKDKSCYFSQDCRAGQVCVKPKGSFKGMCQDDSYQTSSTDIKDAKDPRALLQNFRNSDRQCLADQDCALREVCLKRERTVFGVCRPRSAISTTTTPATTTTNTTSSSSLFPDSDSLFNK